jgi:serine/threonine protein kinase
MGDIFEPGRSVRLRSGELCEITEFLGSGGQGEVYKVKYRNRLFALKWYYEDSGHAKQKAALEDLIRRGKPQDNFLWPEELTEAEGVRGFGYLMRLRETKYKSLSDLVSCRVDVTALSVINIGIELTKAFKVLHHEGLFYRDISFGNAFIDPDSGDVLICDNDNVAINKSSTIGVLGTPDFMAPEIVRGETDPSRSTDLHSLSVLLFYIFHHGHPLMGRRMLDIHCWDSPARDRFFGECPVFIFDPINKSNEAVSFTEDPTGEAGGTALEFWKTYPKPLTDTFTRAFTTGLQNPNARVTALDWLNTFAEVRDSVFKCGCGTPNYYNPEFIAKNQRLARCWHCKREPSLPFRIRVGRTVIMLNENSKLYLHHMRNGNDYDFYHSVAEVVQHPTDPNIWGLKNLSQEKWVTSIPGGSIRDIEPGRSVPLASGIKINFGSVEGEIRY